MANSKPKADAKEVQDSKPVADSKPEADSKPVADSKPEAASKPKTAAKAKSKDAGKAPAVQLRVDRIDRDDGKIQLTVTVPAQKINELLEDAANALALQNHLDLTDVEADDQLSFIIETVGEAQYKAFASYYAMSAMTPHAITQKNLETIMDPDFNAIREIVPGRDFSFLATLTPKPHFLLSSYGPVTIKLSEITVSEEEIDNQILILAEQNAELAIDAEGQIADNSEMSFTIKTSIQETGEEVPRLSAESLRYQTSQGFMPAEFDAQIMGMKTGESRTFDYELPWGGNPDGSISEYRTVTSTVEILQIDKRVIPTINNAWIAEHLPEATDIDGLREMIKAEGLNYKAVEQENMKAFLAASALAERLEGKLPDELYEFTRREMMANLNNQIRQQGMTFEQYLQSMGMDQQQFNLSYMMNVHETLRQGFALDAMARHLKLSVSQQDMEDVARLKAPNNTSQFLQQLEASGQMYLLREAALRTKATRMLVETAIFEAPEAAETETA